MEKTRRQDRETRQGDKTGRQDRETKQNKTGIQDKVAKKTRQEDKTRKHVGR